MNRFVMMGMFSDSFGSYGGWMDSYGGAINPLKNTLPNRTKFLTSVREAEVAISGQASRKFCMASSWNEAISTFPCMLCLRINSHNGLSMGFWVNLISITYRICGNRRKSSSNVGIWMPFPRYGNVLLSFVDH